MSPVDNDCGSAAALEACGVHLELLGRLLRNLPESLGKESTAQEEPPRASPAALLRHLEQSSNTLAEFFLPVKETCELRLKPTSTIHVGAFTQLSDELNGIEPCRVVIDEGHPGTVGGTERLPKHSGDAVESASEATPSCAANSQGDSENVQVSRSGRTLKSTLKHAVRSIIVEEEVDEWPPLTELLGDMCIFARISLFLSGFAYFRKTSVRVAYNSIYALSFLICGLTCLASVYWRTPPLFTWMQQLTTGLMHVLGVHMWLFCRRYSLDLRMRTLVHDLIVSPAGTSGRQAARRRIRCLVKVASTMTVLTQLIGVSLACASLSQPAYEHWAAGPMVGHKGRLYALLHAITMWVAIPQTIFSMMASLMLFCFVMVCHCRDIMEVVVAVKDVNQELVSRERQRFQSWRLAGEGELMLVDSATLTKDEEKEVAAMQRQIVNAVCTLADNAQRRLDYTCRSVGLLNVHQVCFGFLMVMILLTHYNTVWKHLVQWDRAHMFRMLLDALACCFAIILVFTGVVLPAVTTHVFIKAPRMIVSAMCNRGVSCVQAAPAVPFLYSKVVGFTTIFYIQVTASAATKFIAAASLGSALYASTLSSWYPST